MGDLRFEQSPLTPTLSLQGEGEQAGRFFAHSIDLGEHD